MLELTDPPLPPFSCPYVYGNMHQGELQGLADSALTKAKERREAMAEKLKAGAS